MKYELVVCAICEAKRSQGKYVPTLCSSMATLWVEYNQNDDDDDDAVGGGG